MSAQQVQCPNCQTMMPNTARFCPGCEAPRTAVREAAEDMARETGRPYEDIIAEEIARDKETRANAALAPAIAAIQHFLMPGEQIIEYALQGSTTVALHKGALVATDRRIIFVWPSMRGAASFDDYHWREVVDVHLKQGSFSTEFTVRTAKEGKVISGLDRAAARRLYTVAQHQEHEWHEERRRRQMEEDRAKAGGLTLNMGELTGLAAQAAAAPPMAPAAADPMERLTKAKAMLDAGLITEREYDATKQRILAEL